MAVCKDCLHYDACYIIEEYGDDGETGVEYGCNKFLYRDEYVPVVRCKDCKHSREQNIDERKYLIEGVLICTSPDATDKCWNPVFGKHFCSYGEGKNNEQHR